MPSTEPPGCSDTLQPISNELPAVGTRQTPSLSFPRSLGAKLSRALSSDSGKSADSLDTVASKGKESNKTLIGGSLASLVVAVRGKIPQTVPGVGPPVLAAHRNATTNTFTDTTMTYDSTDNDAGRSASRGREGRDGYRSSGRGGVGNIVRSPSNTGERLMSPSREPYSEGISIIRGRNAVPVSTGRGGAGNILNRSRSNGGEDIAGQQQVEKSFVNDSESETVASYGLSRAPTEPQQEHGLTQDQLQATAAGAYSTGRGGAGNIVGRNQTSPSHSPAHSHSRSRERTGGGIFNRGARSKSREPTSPSARRSRSREAVSGLWDRLTHPHMNAPTHAPEDVNDASAQESSNEPQVVNRGRPVDVPIAIAE
ncbi:hypothetical protein PUNSTDRAFT_46528 [Punctularia strigosozonata HHB-11173 SS5]|uniref:uncharacterized protein n=1 Tax=Punctularia strigosozonata (strain HHB-11173) TaxID=741275 RepID=UPI0004417530|nr:uncharacterized protein PUNSTDRAFT_46528 [Punctularia strigosozonata HHB-11173 SS5]EIN06354.1 hypothetical protein PUNSTDRAFT_46528 [Punctularia strigosozonata HHB-11173 SS5]